MVLGLKGLRVLDVQLLAVQGFRFLGLAQTSSYWCLRRFRHGEEYGDY